MNNENLITEIQKDEIVEIQINKQIGKDVKLLVKLNTFVKHKTKLGSITSLEGKTKSIESPIYGRIAKIESDNELDIIIIEKCAHETTYHNLCVHCGFDIKKSENSSKTNNFLSISSALNFSENKAKEEEKNIVKKLLEKQKLILLLDIDNTFVHSAVMKLTQDEYEALKDKYGWMITKLKVANQSIYVKFRPQIKEFLEGIEDLYEIYIYTYGTLEYAREIMKYLNETLQKEYFCFNRLVARDNNINYEFKSIKRIFPSAQDMVLLLDDRVDVWKEDCANLINISAYMFFNEAYTGSGIKFKPEDDDCVFYSIQRLLVFINKVFYSFYSKNDRKTLHVQTILETKMDQIFPDKVFVFSNLYGKDINIFQTFENTIITRYGGYLEEEFGDDTEYVLTKEFQNTSKILKAVKNNKEVLSVYWIHFCNMFICGLSTEMFKLTKEHPKYDNSINQLKVLENNKEIIDSFYDFSEETIKSFLDLIENDENNVL